MDAGKQPMKVRIAGKNYAVSSKDLKSRKAEVIDIPVPGKLTTIASCQTSSNLLIVVETKIFLYRLVTKQHSNSDQMYQVRKSGIKLYNILVNQIVLIIIIVPPRNLSSSIVHHLAAISFSN